MSKGRCGNSDGEAWEAKKRRQYIHDLKEKTDEKVDVGLASPEIGSGSAVNNGARRGARKERRRRAINVTETGGERRSTMEYQSTVSTPKTSVATELPSRISVERSPNATSPRSLLGHTIRPTEQPSGSGSARRNRQNQLRQIIARKREEHYNMSANEEQVSASQRQSDREAIALVPTRKRRSISIQPMGGVSERVETDRTRFDKDENSPVQWRLLDSGISGKIPLPDQRAILELAFRMWSEVIPLKFSEANLVNLLNMDVIVAFAKREFLNTFSLTSLR